MSNLYNDQEYEHFLQAIKQQIQQAQVKAVLAVNTELIRLYWSIGKEILQRQKVQQWGAKVVDQLSKDLKSSFSNLKGFSRRNLLYMRKFAEEYPSFEFVQAALAQISWYHNITLLEKCKDKKERLWYAQKAIANGWSRNVMLMQMETNLYERQGAVISNFQETLPSANSDLVRQTLKDPYIFDFLELSEDAKERDIEQALIDNISQFLLEMGHGFAFMGKQYPLEIGGKDFFIDLLFYHTQLRCYVVVELKAGEFKPEYTGKLNFYLSAVDDLLKHPEYDAPTIGILLCKERNKIIAEYALKNIEKPIGISGYTLSAQVPNDLKGKLPSIAELENKINSIDK